MLSALQKRLLVCRGLQPRARARLLARHDSAAVDARETGLDREHAGLVGDGETGIVDLDGEGAHDARAFRCRRET